MMGGHGESLLLTSRLDRLPFERGPVPLAPARERQREEGHRGRGGAPTERRRGRVAPRRAPAPRDAPHLRARGAAAHSRGRHRRPRAGHRVGRRWVREPLRSGDERCGHRRRDRRLRAARPVRARPRRDGTAPCRQPATGHRATTAGTTERGGRSSAQAPRGLRLRALLDAAAEQGFQRRGYLDAGLLLPRREPGRLRRPIGCGLERLSEPSPGRPGRPCARGGRPRRAHGEELRPGPAQPADVVSRRRVAVGQAVALARRREEPRWCQPRLRGSRQD